MNQINSQTNIKGSVRVLNHLKPTKEEIRSQEDKKCRLKKVQFLGGL